MSGIHDLLPGSPRTTFRHRLIDGSLRVPEDGVIFERKEWQTVEGPPTDRNPSGLELRPEPGTWMKPPKGANEAFLALVCCPGCTTVSVLHKSIHAIEWVREILTAANGTPWKFRCTGAQRQLTRCNFEAQIVLASWNKKTLYACTLEQYKRVEYTDGSHEIKSEIEITYLHANSDRDARIQLGPINPRRTKIIAIAPAVGVIAKDDNGDQLVIDRLAK